MRQEGSVTAAQEESVKKPAGKKHKKGHPLRNGLIALGIAAALGVGGFFLFRFLNAKEETDSQMMTQTADFGSIQSSVQGSGSARSKESAAITLQNAGTVQKLYVAEGQVVAEGDPLYEIVSPAAQEAYDAAVSRVQELQKGVEEQYSTLKQQQKALADRQKEYDELLDDQKESNEERSVKAPFAGQLRETARYRAGDKVSRGEKVAVLVNDHKFRIPFYFSYAYEGQIAAGQAVRVTVSGSDLAGVIEEVNPVRRVTAEGTLLFEAVAVIDNPGALTEGLSATASLTGADGQAIYPYEAGTLEFYQTQELWSKAALAAGDKEPAVVEFTALRDYADVAEGQVVLTLSAEDFSGDLEAKNDQLLDARAAIDKQLDAIASAEKTVAEARDKVAETQEALDDFSAVAPISGTITSCALAEGQEVKSGDTVITISNNTVMVVTIQVDDRNIAYVKPGMTVALQSGWGDGGTYTGTVTKIDMSLSGDAMGSGMTNYPVSLEVDNAEGTLLEGMWLNYSFVTSQSDNCIVVPMQSVKYVSTEDGGTASVVFIRAEEAPENMVEVDLPDLSPGETPTYPSQADGFYAVAVETGLSDSYNVEITSGLSGGEEVFVAYTVTQAYG